MRVKILVIMGFIGIGLMNAQAQEAATDYNPFVPANLDDPVKLGPATVVESSYHYYSLSGDQSYSELSTFVWYVEEGVLGEYDPVTDIWIPASDASPISDGTFVERLGITDATQTNASGIWVRWDDDAAGEDGYVAVYERSSNDCVFDQQITGFKHRILIPPEAWFLVDTREECTDQIYSITVQFNELHPDAYPYTLTYSYPDFNGLTLQKDTLLVASDLDANNQVHWDLEAIVEMDNTLDEDYTISLDLLRDNYGSIGNIAPLGATQGQYPSLSITILHLPQTGNMIMN